MNDKIIEKFPIKLQIQFQQLKTLTQILKLQTMLRIMLQTIKIVVHQIIVYSVQEIHLF